MKAFLLKNLKEIFLSWDKTAIVIPSRLLVAMLSITAPLIYGIYSGRIRESIVMAVAGYLIATDDLPTHFKEKTKLLILEVSSLSIATYVGTFIGNFHFIELYFIVLGLSTLIGSFSPKAAKYSTLFNIMIILARSFGEQHISPQHATALFFMGACWILCVIYFIQPLFDKLHHYFFNFNPPIITDKDTLSFKRKFTHWWHSFYYLSGWLFFLRLLTCLFVAEICAYIWQNPHSYWIATTIAIVVQRNPREAVRKKIQRSLGTCVGVLCASILLLWHPKQWLIITLISVLAGLRPVLKARNYTVYTIVMTPLVMLLFDLVHPPHVEILMERLIATLLGAFIAFVFGYLLWRKFLHAT